MIQTVEELRRLYPKPKERAVGKQLARLDRHCRHFISLSPFVVLASSGSDGLDASPRGGEPGFVKVRDDVTLWIPDSPGNNRLDSMDNILRTGRIGLLFLIPGIDETLRVNGTARLSADSEVLCHFATGKRSPKVVIAVHVEQAFLHCAKALMRARLWSEESRQPRSVLPSMGRMLNDQLGETGIPESQEQMIARYQQDL